MLDSAAIPVSTHSRPKAPGKYLDTAIAAAEVSTHSRPKAAGLFYIRTLNHSTVSTHSRPKAAGIAPIQHPIHHFKFQLTAARRRLAPLPNKRAGELKFQLTAARRRLGECAKLALTLYEVSTHSRPKAAGWLRRKQVIWHGSFNSQPPEGGWAGLRHDYPFNLGFNSQPPEGGWSTIRRNTHPAAAFQLTAARRRLATSKPVAVTLCTFQLTAARRRLDSYQTAISQNSGFNSQPPEGGWMV